MIFRSTLLIPAVVLALLCTDGLMAQRGGRGGFPRMDNDFNLLQNESVRREIEMTEDQLKETEELRDGMFKGMREMFGGMRNMSQEERTDAWQNLRKEMEVKAKEAKQQLSDILLPHQLKRLEQLSFQTSIRGNWSENTKIVDALNITPEQQEAMKKAAEKAGERLKKEMAKLQERARNEILAVLEPGQRTKFEELFGQSFQMEETRRRRGRGAGEGRGNRDGRGGGRERGGRSDF